jgi:four helix bundle protein
MAKHETLKAWQHARALAVACAKASRAFPDYEQGGLADQFRRAGYSVVLNITEGTSRRGRRELRRFLDIAKSSADEVDAILGLALDLGYISPDQHRPIKALRDETARTLYGLLRSISEE